jgi:spore germination cell wall hydrolase CwlJ-like protein
MLPARTGYQDIAALVARQSAGGGSFRAHLIASPFGTIHAATFHLPQPVGTGIPPSAVHLAAYDPAGDVTGAISRALLTPPDIDGSSTGSHHDFPQIDRTLKGARLVSLVRPELAQPQSPTAGEPDRQAALESTDDPDDLDATERDTTPSLMDQESAPIRAARVYFGAAPLGGTPAPIEPWAPGQAPIFEPPEGRIEVAALNPTAPAEPPRNETIAPKGEVTGEGLRPKSPAERLGLVGAARAKHERCLADAIYFEARGESVRGQMAVAQVVVNRVFSGYYPNNVCGVVYQNSHRHLACQFTFACDGIPDRINEPAAWERAKHIARDALDGKFWLNDVGKATHYHAYWVHPWWVREMRKLDRIGVHTFYRPRHWGDGAASPIWGDAVATATAAKEL